jgi:hypothetical protein
MACDPELAAACEIAAHHVRRQEHHGRARQPRLLPDALGHGEAVEVRHAGIEEDQAEHATRGPRLLEGGQRRAPVGDDRRGHAP